MRTLLGPDNMSWQERKSMWTYLGTLAVATVILNGCAELPVRNKVLVIGVDGVRVDVLMRADTPNLDALIAEGTFTDQAQTRAPTVSGPGWSSMLTGVWSDKHRVTGNNFAGNAYAAYPDFLTRLERVDSSLSTFAVVNWPPLGEAEAGGPLLSDEIDVKITVNGDSLGYATADAHSVARAVEHLVDQDLDAAFVYLGNPDVVGHDTHSLSPEYERSLEVADAQIGQLLDAVQGRRTHAREDWLILISTDHGRRNDGGHGGESALERTIFYLASGPSAERGAPSVAASIVDVAVTALVHMGVTLDPAWDLDGGVVGLRDGQ